MRNLKSTLPDTELPWHKGPDALLEDLREGPVMISRMYGNYYTPVQHELIRERYLNLRRRGIDIRRIKFDGSSRDAIRKVHNFLIYYLPGQESEVMEFIMTLSLSGYQTGSFARMLGFDMGYKIRGRK